MLVARQTWRGLVLGSKHSLLFLFPPITSFPRLFSLSLSLSLSLRLKPPHFLFLFLLSPDSIFSSSTQPTTLSPSFFSSTRKTHSHCLDLLQPHSRICASLFFNPEASPSLQWSSSLSLSSFSQPFT
ncbi:hypothetical protein I3843_01G029000 [Carya illinoinensis]|nr:hypothetical protein I3843_01G029000 [Carya illinoinensis]